MASTVRQIKGYEVEIDRTDKLIHISDRSGKLLMSMTESEMEWVPELFEGVKAFYDEYGWGKEHE